MDPIATQLFQINNRNYWIATISNTGTTYADLVYAAGVDRLYGVIETGAFALEASSGIALFSRRPRNTSTGNAPALRCVTAGPSGEFYLAGVNSNPNRVFVAYNSSGTLLSFIDAVSALTGDVFGMRYDSANQRLIYVGSSVVGSFATNLTEVWGKTIDITGASDLEELVDTAVCNGASPGVYAAGRRLYIPFGEAIIVKYALDGTHVATRSAYTSLTSISEGKGIAVSNSGDAVYAVATGQGKAFLLKYDSGLTLQWQRQISLSGNTVSMTDVVVDSAGNIYTVGSAAGSGVIFKYNSSGGLIWQRKLSHPSSTNVDCRKIALDDKGSMYICGAGLTASINLYWIKLPTDGSKPTTATTFMTYEEGVCTDAPGGIIEVAKTATLGSYTSTITTPNKTSLAGPTFTTYTL